MDVVRLRLGLLELGDARLKTVDAAGRFLQGLRLFLEFAMHLLCLADEVLDLFLRLADVSFKSVRLVRLRGGLLKLDLQVRHAFAHLVQFALALGQLFHCRSILAPVLRGGCVLDRPRHDVVFAEAAELLLDLGQHIEHVNRRGDRRLGDDRLVMLDILDVLDILDLLLNPARRAVRGGLLH